MNLKIECPSCQRHFQVHEDLSGKMVECGACDHRFKVEKNLVVKEKEKFYPGEHHDDLLDRVGRSPVRSEAAVSFQTANYNQQPDDYSPASPTQKVALLAGAGLILGFTALFFIGTMDLGGLFSEVPKNSRYLLAGFVILLGGGLITWGARNWRDRGILLILVLAGLLLTLVTIREVKTMPGTKDEDLGNFAPAPEIDEDAEKAAMISRMHLKPLDDAIEKARAQGISQPESTVIGIYIHGIGESRELSVTQYLSRQLSTASDAPPLFLPRNDTDALVIVEGLLIGNDEIFTVVSRLGKTFEHPQLRLLEVKLSPDTFEDPGPENFEKLNDYKNPAFYNRNLLELDQVNFERVKSAIERLANLPPDAEPLFKPEITRKLVELLGQETDPDSREALSRALRRWNSTEPAVIDQAGAIAKNFAKRGEPVPEALVDFLIAAGYDGVGELVDALWLENALAWHDQYLALGPAAEPRLITHLRNASPDVQKAAIKLLHNLGGAASVQALAPLESAQDPEIQILVVNALKAIRGRM